MVRIIYIITALIFSFVVKAQDLEKSLLWKISGNGLEKPSYLFGTMHAVCDVNLNNNINNALDETSQLYLEIDIDDPNLQSKMMKGMILKDGITISSLMNEEDSKILDAFLKKNIGISLKIVDKFKPFIINSMFIPKLLDCPIQSVEAELMTISMEQNEEIFGLETIEEQLIFFDKIPYKIQIEELVRTAKDDLAKDKIEMKEMIKVYNNEDIEKMLKMIIDSDNRMMADFNEVILNERNTNWIPIISKVALEKPTFFAVGSGHLAGENGVIKLLRREGFQVEAIN